MIGQDRHDLAQRQGRELAWVAGEQDSLPLLLAQAMRNQSMAAFTAIKAVPEVGAFYWTVLAPDIVNSRREEQGSISV